MHNMNKLIKYSAFFLVFFNALSAFSQQVIEESFSGIRKINMKFVSGDCVLVKSTDSKIQLKLEESFGGIFHPSMVKDGDVLTLKETFDSGTSRGSSKWVLTVPDDIEISFHSASGGFTASDFKLKLDFSSGSGGVRLSGFDGSLKVSTGSGSIIVDSSKGDLNLNTGSGKVQLDDFNGSLRISSGSGNANLDFGGNRIEGTVVMKAAIRKQKGRIIAPFDFDTVEEVDDRNNSNQVLRKTATFGSKDISIVVTTGTGTARVER